MSLEDAQETIRNLIQIEVVKALNNAEDTIEKLVKAALSKPVDPTTGRSDGYMSRSVPFLDYLVGDEIRHATIKAVRQVIGESQDKIEAEVRKGLSSETVVAAVTNALIGAAKEDWRISVNFENEDTKRR